MWIMQLKIRLPVIHAIFIAYCCYVLQINTVWSAENDTGETAESGQNRRGPTPSDKRGTPNIMLIFIENIKYLQNVLDLNRGKKESSILNLPNLQKLREESILFNHALSELHSVSSSATLLTGLPAVHTGMIKGKILPFTEMPSIASTGGLQHDHANLAESIKHVTQDIAKYITAFVGYWKLGHGKAGMYLPHNRGFDFWTGVPFKHSTNCNGRMINSGSVMNNEATRQQYIDLLFSSFPWWFGLVIGMFTACFFKAISWRGLVNALISLLLSSFICFALLKAYRVQKNASCLLYHVNEITEQPYNMENLTLFFTTNVISLLDVFSAQSQPFFLHLNYVKLNKPHFSSNYFRNNSKATVFDSLLELDWSIGSIMTRIEELELADDTIIILTGSNDCQINAVLGSHAAYERKDKNLFMPTTAKDVVEECLQVPLYLKHSKIKSEKKEISTPVSFLDVAPTILELLTNVTQDDYPGCSIIPLLHQHHSTEDSNLPKVYSLKHVGMIDEQLQNRHRCNPGNRLHLHYADITKPIAVTIGDGIRILFTEMDEKNRITPLKYPRAISLQENVNIQNISIDYLEELYRNVSSEIEKQQVKRVNKWSSQFEMPVYPWLLPCANFPRCEVHNHFLSDFSHLEPINSILQAADAATDNQAADNHQSNGG